jgi:hypothetical protein
MDLGSTTGILTISGNYTQTAAGTLALKVGGTTAGSQYDQVNISGTATLGGTLNLALINGFSPSGGQVFAVITFSSSSDSFATFNPPLLGGKPAFSLNSTATGVELATTTQWGTSTAVISSANPSVYGQPLNLTATVSVLQTGGPTPTGTVSLKDGPTPLGTVSLSGGTATFSLAKLAAGSHSFTVTYNADPAFLASTSSVLTQIVTPLAITGSITAANKVYDGTTTATITNRALTGVLSGDSVSYIGGTATFGDKNVGTAKTVTATGLSLSGTDAGNYTFNTTASAMANITAAALTITASFAGDAVHQSGSISAGLTVNNVPPTVGAITAPVNPQAIGTTINPSASFTDPGVRDTHTAAWNWGDGTTSTGSVTETNGSGSVGGSHSYSSDGVFPVTLTVTDDDGGVSTSVFQYEVIYNPTAGFATGGGWITSPAGAYASNSTLTGKASFGIDVKYQPGSTIPAGSRGTGPPRRDGPPLDTGAIATDCQSRRRPLAAGRGYPGTDRTSGAFYLSNCQPEARYSGNDRPGHRLGQPERGRLWLVYRLDARGGRGLCRRFGESGPQPHGPAERDGTRAGPYRPRDG